MKLLYRDGYATIKSLSFKQVLDFTKLQALMRDPIKEDPTMVELLDFYKDNIKVFDKKDKEISLESLDLDSFRELCIKTLLVSLPKHSVQYSFPCRDSQVKNFDKLTLQDELRAITRRLEEKGDPKLEKAKESVEEKIKSLPDMVECVAIVEEDISYSDLDSEKEYLRPRSVKIEGVEVVGQSVKAKLLIEKITRHEVLSDRITFVESIDDEEIGELGEFVQNKELDFEKLLEKDLHIIFDILFLASHSKKALRGIKSLIKVYDRLFALPYDELKAYDLKVEREVTPFKEKTIVTECGSCKKEYSLSLSIEDFSFVPE